VKQTPEQQWFALSALYEEADALPAHALPAWLARLEGEGHPLLPQLRRMLDARTHLEKEDFLGTLPKLAAREPEPASEWAAGGRLGPYRLVRPLGAGGMAEVWLADRDDGLLKRQVAIKLPYPRAGRESLAVRFERERNILASLRHPHIAGLIDAGVTSAGQAWLALEYVEGQSISEFCDERELPLRERMQLFRQVLLAVQHAHANLVIHRDLKPANILVTPEGEVRLLDFGIAKLFESGGDAIAETELTRQAGRALTLRYASPEQLTGLPLTTACDVYSLGVVFYELMCGERPYERAETAPQLERAILETDPRAPSRRTLLVPAARARGTTPKGLRRQLAPELDAIALRCLAKKPAARYSSVDALVADVDRWLTGEAVLARAPGPWYRFRKFALRHRLGVGLGAAAVASLAAVATVAVILGLQAREESARAVAARDFMLDLFRRADQEKSRGADITARELLETGRKQLLTRLAGQPTLQAELLQGIGNIQRDMGEHAHADSSFAEAARLYGELGRRRDTALAHAARADNAVRLGDHDLAAVELRHAQSHAGAPGRDVELAVRLAEIEGWIAEGRGDAERARRLFTEHEQLAMRAWGPNHPRTLDALRALIRVERQVRNDDAALALQDRLEAAAARTAGIHPKEGAAMQWERADLLYGAGRYAEGLAHIQTALPRCDAALGPNDDACRRLFFNRMRLLARLGWTVQARAETPRLRALADDPTSPLLQIEALLQWFRIESLAEPGQGATALFERVRAFGESGPEVPVPSALKAKALLALAEARLLAGDPVAARRWIEQARAHRARGGDAPRADVLEAVSRSLEGVALLQERRADDAVVRMREAQRDFEALFGAEHALARMFSLNVALALEARGRTEEALGVVSRAEAALKRALGADAPVFARVAALRARLQSAAAAGGRVAGARNEPPRAQNLDFFS